MRKMGLVELLLLLLGMASVGHYLYCWAVYAEKQIAIVCVCVCVCMCVRVCVMQPLAVGILEEQHCIVNKTIFYHSGFLP